MRNLDIDAMKERPMSIEELRAIAQAAGRWDRGVHEHVADCGEPSVVVDHILTFDPVLVQAMLDVIEVAEQVHEYGFDCHGHLEDALVRFREVAP